MDIAFDWMIGDVTSGIRDGARVVTRSGFVRLGKSQSGTSASYAGEVEFAPGKEPVVDQMTKEELLQLIVDRLSNQVALMDEEITDRIAKREAVEPQPALDPWADPTIEPPTELIDAERDRRISSGFEFEGVVYQSRREDWENISGAATAALGAIMNGAAEGNFRWHGGASDFVWISADNSEHPMDAQTMFSLGQAAMAHKQAHVFAGRALKDAGEIPADYTNDAYWPA